MDSRFAALLAAAVVATLAPVSAQAGDPAELERVRKRVVTQGAVCPDPARPCTLAGGPFKPNELSFDAPIRFEFDRGEDRSQPFHAVILRSGAICIYDESRRLEVQALFPDRKVFAHRHFCEDFGDKVTYTNIDRTRGFIGVYAGRNEREAKAFLAQVRKDARFRDAYLRKMQVVVKWQVE
jgi:hypothetical protein